MFTIDNEKNTNRRIIANEFNKYFVSLNEAYSEIGELEINPIPSFYDYLPNSNMSNIYKGDYTPNKIMKIISELQNGKASDKPIHVIKKSSRFISPIQSVLYNKCLNDGIFPNELKVGKISPIYKKDKEELIEKLQTSLYPSYIWKNR